MAQASQKISKFPTPAESQSAIAKTADTPMNVDPDPTLQVRNLIEQLQESTREARRAQAEAEKECQRLRGALAEQEVPAELSRVNDPAVKALKHERDILLEQQNQYGPLIAELKQKLKALEAENAQALRDRDQAIRTQKQATREFENALRAAEESERKRDEALHQRDAAIRQRDLAKDEQETSLAKIADVTKNFTAAQKALAEAKKGDPELAGQIASLRQARDGMGVQINELKRKVAELEDEKAELSYGREAAEKAASESRNKLDELLKSIEERMANAGDREKIAGLETALDESRKTTAELAEAHRQAIAELEDLRGKLDALTSDREANAQTLEGARTSLLAAHKQIEVIIRDRDATVQQLSATSIAMEAELKERIAESVHLKEELGGVRSKLSEVLEQGARFEQRRLDMIELNARLENAHREIRNLSASLAESRLQAKFAATKAGLELAQSKSRANAPAPKVDEDPERKSTIVEMRGCFQGFHRDHSQLGLLDELEAHAKNLANGARDNGQPVLHRVTVALATLIGDLREVPDQISHGTLSTVNQTIEFIAALLKNPEVEHTVDLAQARVYVVDDDRNTCDTVVDALNMVGLQTHYALYSSEAVAELAGSRYELIILDVNLPDLDGFELCSHIRNMALHAETPVFFITGHTSLENRVKSSLRGGNEFLAKPFNIQELALKALTSVISSQLHGR